MQLMESGEVTNDDASSRVILSATILEAEHSCSSVCFEVASSHFPLMGNRE